MTAATSRIGRIGEELAARHLTAVGMTIVDRNWHAHHPQVRGELDLVARDGPTIVFCEVKTQRRASAAGPLEFITPDKVRRIRRLAGLWLAEHDVAVPSVRLDGIGVSWPSAGGGPCIDHVRDLSA